MCTFEQTVLSLVELLHNYAHALIKRFILASQYQNENKNFEENSHLSRVYGFKMYHSRSGISSSCAAPSALCHQVKSPHLNVKHFRFSVFYPVAVYTIIAELLTSYLIPCLISSTIQWQLNSMQTVLFAIVLSMSLYLLLH